MNFDEIEKAWQSPHNRPATAQLEMDKMKFATTLQKRHRAFLIQMTLAILMLSIPAGMLIRQLFAPAGASLIHVSKEWAVIAYLLLPWCVAVSFVLHYIRHRKGWTIGSTISENVRALREQSRLSLVRLQAMLGLHLAGVPLIFLCVHQIEAAGKARPNEVASMIFFFAMAILVSVTGIAFTLHRKRKELAGLDALLKSYE